MNLQSLGSLEELYLGANRIREIKGLETLKGLRILSIQANYIKKVQGLDALAGLEELYLSQNFIEVMEGLDHLPKLKTLDMAKNKIKKIGGVEKTTALEELWLNENQVGELADIEGIGFLQHIVTIYLEGNPVAKLAEYRIKVLQIFPKIQQIDGDMITPAYKVKYVNDAPKSITKKEIPQEAQTLIDKVMKKQ